MKTAEQIVELYEQRRRACSAWHQRALEIKRITYGELILPLPEVDENERPAIANTVLIGVEQHAMRISSTSPSVYYPSMRPGFKEHDERARSRRLVTQFWWEQTALDLKMMKRARHLVAYAMSPVVIRPDFEYQCPKWEVRDPLCTFAPELQAGEMYPDDCVFTYTRPFSWLKARYPEQAQQLAARSQVQDADTFDLIEYVDADEYVLCVAGQAAAHRMPSPGGHALTLERLPNRAGMPLAVVPGRISLDRPQGQFDGLVGMFQLQAQLMAMEIYGMRKAIFPETWAVSTVQGVPPTIIHQADAMRGEMGVMQDGRIEKISIEPSVLGGQFVNTLERNQRVEGAIPAEFGGEAASNVRTGRRGDSIISNTTDFHIQSAHRIFERSLECENRVAVAVDKGYFDHKKSFVVSASKGQFDYVPSETFDTDKNFVRYSHAGADANALVVAGGQRVGLGTMSRRGFMEMDPLIEDAESESDRITFEGLEQAALQSLQSQAQSDPSFILPLTKIADKVLTNKQGLLQAIISTQKELQAEQEQAAQGEAPPEEMQPGLAEPLPSVPESPGGLENLSSMLMQMRSSGQGAQPRGVT